MRVFVAGATGAIGRQLVPLLVADGHDVVGMVRGEGKIDAVREMGAEGVVADALDPAPPETDPRAMPRTGRCGGPRAPSAPRRRR
jgi:uncharacterized protein YbjT (DUF2867 family)